MKAATWAKGRLTLLAAIGFAISACPAPSSWAADQKGPARPTGPVSYYRQVRPILQRSCSGCHQPAKRAGKLLLTTYEGFKAGGENGAAFVPGKPEDSLVVQYISGPKPEMPKNGEPLKPLQIELISKWIGQGGKNDTPASVQDPVTAENPPKYSSPPVIPALAYSPDSSLLAVAGFHEVLLHKANGSGLIARLIGQAQRIESVAFSPDGKTLGAVGGTPALLGEVQFWNVADKKLSREIPVTYDSLYGASFNNDGTLFAFGGADNRARIVRLKDGKEIMRFDAHSDYVLGTTFSLKQDHLISVSRDMSMKLVIVENGQFVDNITSITPGALKGGLVAVERHPLREEVLTGGADGEPKLYQIFRTKTRVIGDDFNRIRTYAALPGRIFSLRFNKDGSRFVVGASTATSGTARIYDTETGALLHELPGIAGPIYAVDFRPDGQQVAVAGFEGKVRLYDASTGKLVTEFIPVKITPAQQTAAQ
jgi:mono/diheme cytochrome c family protein/DNA-binding beta-propeller fold protein YncE